jgi:hypothetical protein
MKKKITGGMNKNRKIGLLGHSISRRRRRAFVFRVW